MSPAQSSVLRLPSPLSEMEAKHYYYGLPSAPVLVARSSTTPWEAPTGPEAYHKPKELRPVYNHSISEAWGGDLPRKVIATLDSMKVNWTSLDIVRIGYEGEHPGPVDLWIGVLPESLCSDDGLVAVSKCRELLEEYGIADVDVEIRESVRWPRY